MNTILLIAWVNAFWWNLYRDKNTNGMTIEFKSYIIALVISIVAIIKLFI